MAHTHTETQGSTGEITVGSEIWMVVNIVCSECGQFIRYDVISRRKA